MVILHLLKLVRRYGYEFIGIQETQILLEGLERTHPALVREVVPKLVTPVLLADVLRAAGRGGGVDPRPCARSWARWPSGRRWSAIRWR